MTFDQAIWTLDQADEAIDWTYECDFEENFLDPEWQASRAAIRQKIRSDVAEAKAFLRRHVVNILVNDMGYDEVVHHGDHDYVYGYSTDMAFCRDRNLPFNRVALVTDEDVEITSKVNDLIRVKMSLSEFATEIQNLIANVPRT